MICNQRRSRVHKSALAILRAGKKWLQAAELAGRKVQSASLSCIMLQDTKLCVVLFSCHVIKIPALAWNVLQFTPKQFSLLYQGMHDVFLPQQKVWLLPEPAQLRICVALRESETLFVHSSAIFLQAIVMLHPEGVAAAAAEEAQEVQAAHQAAATAARLKLPGISTRRTQLMSESPLTPGASTPCQRLASLQALASLPQTPDMAAAPLPDADDFQVSVAGLPNGLSTYAEA